MVYHPGVSPVWPFSMKRSEYSDQIPDEWYHYGSVSAYMRDTLHWLPIAQRICYRIAVLVWRCLLGSAPGYLCELCRPVSGLPGRRALRSSATGQLLVPRAKTATRQRRAFSIVGPSTWNGLPLEIRILPKNNESAFCRLLKTHLYRRGWAGGASELIS